MNCACHPVCVSCSMLVPTLGMSCQFCVATDLADAGHLSLSELAIVNEGLDEAEQRATACSVCEQGPCGNVCEACAEDDAYSERMHERSHGPGSF